MPKNFPLKLPPGVSRPGTKYDSRGRWFDSSHIRWHEKTMGAVGGWQPAIRVDDLAVSAAISDNGGVFTDFTTEANNAAIDDFDLIPATPQVNDAFYLGWTSRFTEVLVDTGTAATDGIITWEYFNGTAFVPLLGVVDNTDNFKVLTQQSVSWTLPWDWVTTTVNSQGPFYYVRARVTTAGTTRATGDQCFIGDGPIDVDEVIRGMLGWRSNNGRSVLAWGTPTKLYYLLQGTFVEITPAGFVTGGADATSTFGDYGSSIYGSNAYGVGNPAIAVVTEANTWQLDNFGELLIASAHSDGKIYEWDPNPPASIATVVTNAPTGARGVVVTPERFVVTLGATGNLPTGAEGDRREAIWSDQEDRNLWAPALTNQAGSFVLPGAGELLAGIRSRAETLLWTTVDLFAMRYVGGTLVYSFQQVGAQCGAISRMAMAKADAQVYWMGHSKFFVYDGFVSEIPSDVSDFVFTDINRTQASKIFATSLAEKNIVRWYYPSGASTENDRYVEYNWQERHWTIGKLARTAGIDRNAFDFPMQADPKGVIYDHERGTVYLDPDGVALVPFAESGPIELSEGGDDTMDVVGIVPDEKTLGDVKLSIFSSDYPTSTETLHGPFTAREPTDVRLNGRLVRLRIEQVNTGWRFGTPRLRVEKSGQR